MTTTSTPVTPVPVDDRAADLRPLGRGLAVLGAIGLAAAFALTVDKIRLLQDPDFVPGCDLNPVLSCGSVMRTDQAEAFGFPNPLLGLVGFGVVVTVGVLLATGFRPARGVLAGLALGSLAGAGFVHWLAFQSLYRIGALCPWCLVVWAVTIPIMVWSVLTAWRTIRPSRAAERLWSVRYLLVAAWYLTVVVLALVRFWSYWRTLL
ncbi:vitamin K epoxide reductase family protein [Nocardioides sp. HDW12B]|uniref:vitamin K epoxide reductase family protein n=1 Tax=Nocardioides sp. HDW12B TaxID=2714939 RepID=UPI00140BDA21|nr:vitamin K epoxide reductase family protein [Nocardioides sp. HDW12B]QIK68000.1 vitamin K epoxide reductase family protein [Nocardioides sp. HDW12B]